MEEERGRYELAIYHLHMKAIGRGSGRSATAAAAYRSGQEIIDQRTGEVHDYTKKRGIGETALLLPGGGSEDRAQFWNRVELHHKRGDAVVCREIEVSLPAELNPKQRNELALGYARELAERYGVAADVAIHRPSKQGDERNHHAHILLSACRVNRDGSLGKKVAELDPIHCRQRGLAPVLVGERERWAEKVNQALEKHHHLARIDHRTLAAQGIDREPTKHRGPQATAIERKTSEPSQIRQRTQPEPAPPQVIERRAFLDAAISEGTRLRQEAAQQRALEKAQEEARQRAAEERARAQALQAEREREARIRQAEAQRQAQEQAEERARQQAEALARERERQHQEEEKQRLEAEKERQREKERERFRSRDHDRER